MTRPSPAASGAAGLALVLWPFVPSWYSTSPSTGRRASRPIARSSERRSSRHQQGRRPLTINDGFRPDGARRRARQCRRAGCRSRVSPRRQLRAVAASRPVRWTVCMLESLIYDWNKIGAPAKPPRGDARRRDAARRAAVAVGADADHRPEDRDPAPDRRARHRHRRHRPARRRARTWSRDVERLAREIVGAKLSVRANCAARTTIDDITPIAEIAQRTGLPIEVRHVHRLVADPPVHRGLDASSGCCKTTEDAITFAVKEGLEVMYVTEDTTRADPATLRRLYECAIRAGAQRICLADTVGHATPGGASAVVRFAAQVIKDSGADVGIDWHGHRDRDLAIINSIAALEAGATRVHARGARHRRAGRQHADGSAAGQPGGDGFHRARPVAADGLLSRRCRRPAACRFPTTIRWSAATRSAPPPACTPRRSSRRGRKAIAT